MKNKFADNATIIRGVIQRMHNPRMAEMYLRNKTTDWTGSEKGELLQEIHNLNKIGEAVLGSK